MFILITGASGFVGQALQRYLSTQHHTVVVVQRHDTVASLQSQHSHYDCVVHLAGRAHVLHERAETDIEAAYTEVNVGYTMKIAALCQALAVNRFIFLSSVKVNGESSVRPFNETDHPQPKDAYGRSKLAAETALRTFFADSRTELVIIRPPLIYGPGVKANLKALMALCDTPLPLPLAAVHNQRSLVSLQNLVHFIDLCCKHPLAANQLFMISDDADLSTADMVRAIRSALGRRHLLLPVPKCILHTLLVCCGKTALSERLLGNLQVDVSKARQLLGWQPVIDVQQGFQEMVSAL